ncbi:MAG: hypothetical protein WC003_06365 [Terrimicrobiaceae bacterium]
MMFRFSSAAPDVPEQPVGRRSHPSAWLILLVPAVLLGVIGAAWLRQPVSGQELMANFAKAQDFLAAAKSVGGLPWWSPMFMEGTSLATSWSFMATNVVMWAFSVPLGFFAGPKVAALAMMVFGASGVFLFLRKFVGDDLCAGIGGLLFLLCPSVLTRAVGYEHFVVVCSMALLPWTFLALLGFFRRPCLRSALLPAMAFSAVTLTYGKTGVMALPVLLVYSAAEYFGCPRGSRPRPGLLAWAASAFVLLTIVPNLPALRETGFAAMFEFSPFQGWQNAFSTKSALGWIDRAGLLTKGIDGAFAPTTGNGGTYLGLGVFAVFVTALFRGTFHESSEGRKARLFLALALFTFWLSFGPKGVLGGHLFYLSLSLNAPDFSPALGWFFLAAQVWVIFRLVPPRWSARLVLASILSLFYLVVPGFRILEWIPLYRNIPTPFDFFQITGAVCVVISAAIVARILYSRLREGVLRSAVTAAVCCLVLLDVAPYAKPFFQGKLEEEVFGDFLDAGSYIRSSPVPGRVYAFSGRYFYLLTPYLTGRPLISEAFNSYLQQRGATILLGTAFANDETLSSYLNIAGVSHVLIDKRDVDTPADLQGRLRDLLPVGFENDRFVVLDNANSLGAGFLARDFIQASDSQPPVATPALGGAHYNMATIELTGVASDEPGLRGRIVEGRIEAAKSGEAMQEGQPFERVDGKGNYQTVSFEPAGAAGWLVMNQAWHPDWRAFQGDKPLKNRRAFLAFQAVKTDGKQGVEFRFQQPWWYDVCAWVGIFSWVVAGGLILFSGVAAREGEAPSEP